MVVQWSVTGAGDGKVCKLEGMLALWIEASDRPVELEIVQENVKERLVCDDSELVMVEITLRAVNN